MGAGNVKLVYARWGDLPDGPMRLLLYMAVTAMDDGEQPRFWGGRDALAVAMGRMVPDKHTEDDAEKLERALAFKAVNRTIAALRKAGAITAMSGAAPGHNAVYALNLGIRRSPLTGDQSKPKRSPSSGDQSRSKTGPKKRADAKNGPHSAGATVPSNWAERSPFRGQMVPSEWGPEEYEEEVRTESKDESAEVPTTSHPPRVPEAPPKIVELFPGASQEARYRPPPRWSTRGQDAIAEASARVARRKAEHQAQLAADTEVS
jgi:hypothetical protein